MASPDPMTLAITAATTAMSMAQQKKSANANIRAAQQQNQRAVALERQRQAIAERQEKERLKQSLATQRASFGASGISGSGGSSQAVLSGLQNQSNRNIADNAFFTDVRVQGLNSNFEEVKKRNLFDASAPLKRLAINEAQKRLPTKYAQAISLLGD